MQIELHPQLAQRKLVGGSLRQVRSGPIISLLMVLCCCHILVGALAPQAEAA